MSNTLNTPVEALELEFPLRVTEYAVRRGSGGAGRHRGGDGIVREFEALAADGLLAADRAPPPRARRARPAAAPGAPGRNLLDGGPDGAEPSCSGKAEGRLEPGDRLRIETPGGGGYGPPRLTAPDRAAASGRTPAID